jgi:hypothetical protein
MKTVTNKSGQTWVQVDKADGGFTLIPANRWLEDQAALYEMDLAFRLIADNRKNENLEFSIKPIFGKLQEKYKGRWSKLLNDWAESPEAGRLLAKLELDNLLESGD